MARAPEDQGLHRGLEVRCPRGLDQEVVMVNKHHAEAHPPPKGCECGRIRCCYPRAAGKPHFGGGGLRWWCWTSTAHGAKGRTRVDKRKEIGEEQP